MLVDGAVSSTVNICFMSNIYALSHAEITVNSVQGTSVNAINL